MMRLLGDSVFGSGKTPIYSLLWRRRVMAGWLSYQRRCWSTPEGCRANRITSRTCGAHDELLDLPIW